jgi:hypothetical protein
MHPAQLGRPKPKAHRQHTAGRYPGMPASRKFRPIMASENGAQQGDTIVYSGQEISVDLPQ